MNPPSNDPCGPVRSAPGKPFFSWFVQEGKRTPGRNPWNVVRFAGLTGQKRSPDLIMAVVDSTLSGGMSEGISVGSGVRTGSSCAKLSEIETVVPDNRQRPPVRVAFAVCGRRSRGAVPVSGRQARSRICDLSRNRDNRRSRSPNPDWPRSVPGQHNNCSWPVRQSGR